MVCVAGLVLSAYSLAVAHEAAGFSFAGTSPGGAAALLGAGWALVGCGLLHWSKRPGNHLGLLLVCTGGAWLLAEWDSPAVASSLVFSVGLVTYAACPAFVAHVALAYPAGGLSSWLDRVVVVAGYVTAVGLVGLAPALFYGPVAQGCSGCTENLWLVSDRPDLLTRFNRIGVQAGLAWSAVAIFTVAWRLARSSLAGRRVRGWVSLTASAYLAAVVASYASSLERGFLGSTELDQTLWLAQATALVALAGAVAWGLLRARRTQRSLARIVVDLDRAAPPGRLRDALAGLLGDPTLEVAYPVGDGRHVDATAQPVALPPSNGRAATTLRFGGPDVAVLVHRAGLLDNPDVVEELASAARLGLENERLQAEALVQLADLRASGVRIVEAGDEERRRLERDLHDGAQQRLVGLSLALRLLRSRQQGDHDALMAAEAELRGAITDLRALARGIYPVVLRDEGLAAALGALSETSQLRVIDAPSQRFPDVVETTAYQVVATVAAAGPATVTVAGIDDSLVVHVEVQAELAGLGDVEDRVGALEGRLVVAGSDDTTCIDLVLPAVAG